MKVLFNDSVGLYSRMYGKGESSLCFEKEDECLSEIIFRPDSFWNIVVKGIINLDFVGYKLG